MLLCCIIPSSSGKTNAVLKEVAAALVARRDISRASASMLASPWWQSLDPELTLAMADAREGC